MTSASEDQPVLTLEQLSTLVTALQSEVVALKGENESLRETVQNLAHENALYKRRIYGNKTERTRTSEMQLTLGDLLADERRLQKQLDDAVAAANDDAGGDDDNKLGISLIAIARLGMTIAGFGASRSPVGRKGRSEATLGWFLSPCWLFPFGGRGLSSGACGSGGGCGRRWRPREWGRRCTHATPLGGAVRR